LSVPVSANEDVQNATISKGGFVFGFLSGLFLVPLPLLLIEFVFALFHLFVVSFPLLLFLERVFDALDSLSVR